MAIRLLGIAATALVATVGSACAQTVYVEQFTPAPVYVTPSGIDGYVIEQRLVPAYPAATYERQVVTPAIRPAERVITERRVVTEPARRIVRTEPRVVTERRVINREPTLVTTEEPAALVAVPGDAITTETDAVGSCAYDAYGRMICD